MEFLYKNRTFTRPSYLNHIDKRNSYCKLVGWHRRTEPTPTPSWLPITHTNKPSPISRPPPPPPPPPHTHTHPSPPPADGTPSLTKTMRAGLVHSRATKCTQLDRNTQPAHSAYNRAYAKNDVYINQALFKKKDYLYLQPREPYSRKWSARLLAAQCSVECRSARLCGGSPEGLVILHSV